MTAFNIVQHRLSVLRRGIPMGLGIALGCLSGGSMAQTQPPALSDEPTLVRYQPNQYCPANTVVDIPRGVANKTLYRDSVCIREQLRPYQATSQPAKVRYAAHKANAWLAYAYHEASEHSPTPAGTDAMHRAVTLLAALQNNHSDPIAFNTVIPGTSGIARPDLWADILAVKHSPAFANVDVLPKMVADSEVKLIWSEAENCERGWRHANEHFAAADRWVSAAYLTAWHALDAEQQANLKTTRTAYLAQLAPLSEPPTERTKTDFWPMPQHRASCHGAVLPTL